MSQELQGLLAVAEEIVNNEFTACNCGQVCDSTCTHGKLVLAIAKAKTALYYDHRAGAELVRQARELYECEIIQVDDSPPVDKVDEGTWVQAWVLVQEEVG
jgi:hypothetical protein